MLGGPPQLLHTGSADPGFGGKRGGVLEPVRKIRDAELWLLRPVWCSRVLQQRFVEYQFPGNGPQKTLSPWLRISVQRPFERHRLLSPSDNGLYSHVLPCFDGPQR